MTAGSKYSPFMTVSQLLHLNSVIFKSPPQEGHSFGIFFIIFTFYNINIKINNVNTKINKFNIIINKLKQVPLKKQLINSEFH